MADTQAKSDRHNLKRWLDVLASVGMIAASVSILWANYGGGSARTEPDRRGTPSPVPSEPISIAGALTKGATTAPAALILFSDFECPFCRVFAQEVLPEVERNYLAVGRAILVFKDFPLTAIHQRAVEAAAGVRCAEASGKGWAMHDLLFQEPRIGSQTVTELATKLAVPSSDFQQCMKERGPSLVKQDIKIGEGIGLNSTPTVFVGRVVNGNQVKVLERVSGRKEYASVSAALDRALAKGSR